ncbi:MAG: aldehyde dehydrogenase family protein [Flavisolibacter sp.]
MKIINPATEELITELKEDNRSSLNEKFLKLKEAQPSWQEVPLTNRIEVIRNFSRLLEKEEERLAKILTSEVGKPLQQSRNELAGARTRIKWLTENAEKYLSDEWMSTGSNPEEKIVYEPLGVVCNISAWNYPWLVGVNVYVPALMAGNAVCYKPSEFASLTGLEVASLFKNAGLPDNLFLTAIGARETGKALLEIPFDGFFFTGSYRTGKSIYEKLASRMVTCQCELGGKDPLYVTDDISDITSVAASTADGAFYNNGQSCCAVERIYVHEKCYDQYLDAFVKEVQSWKTGSPLEEGVYIGPLTRKAQLEWMEQQVADAVNKGAQILTGGKRRSEKGFYFEPTVLANVNHDMMVMREESFGPLIGIMKVKDDEEAIRLMQDTDYGLTASVYSSNQSRAESILKKIDAGTGYWNCCDRVSAALPWSGRKNSGIGSTLSHTGLRAFTKAKAYHLKTL